MAYSYYELLARLVECEAGGEGEVGMKAVANVVMNRVHTPYGEYARIGRGNLRNIIFQEGQFDCARETIGGVYNPQNIYNILPSAASYGVSDWALSGNSLPNLTEALWYFNPYSPTCRTNFPSRVGYFVIRIGDHCFYNPTSYYLET